MRFWLRDPEYAWVTPAPLQGRWSGVYDGLTPDSQSFPLEPAIRSASDGKKNDDEGEHQKVKESYSGDT